ncbi:MAG TPA: phospholipase D family protein [Pseudomonadales bacterium]|nr:phospholipase D family protein [Pseudomonadales bacterium]
MAALLLAVGCATLPDPSAASPSHKLPATADSFLARKAAAASEDPSVSALTPLATGTDAFLARVALAKLAERSLDLQYYIWHRDSTGNALAAQLLLAADRGVRVRLLLDDLGSPVGDERLLSLSAHPSIEVRLFNPVADRDRGVLGLALDFGRINHRMHNKSMTADNAMTIVGGRNIGDEYFGAGSTMAFADLDVLGAGAVADQVSDSFDLFWNSSSAWPIEALAKQRPSSDEVAAFEARMRALAESSLSNDYVVRLQTTDLAEDARDGALTWYVGEVQVLHDDPDKATGKEDDLLIEQLHGVLDEAEEELVVVSPYFVPGDPGVALFRRLVERGVRVTIITNSLSATDVGAVHAGYARYRKDLLRAGVTLYELRPDVERVADAGRRPGYLPGSSSRASLHAKTFCIDREQLFVGSMNLDPRSVLINTEVGVVIDNPALASMAAESMLEQAQIRAYRVELDDDDALLWRSSENGEAVVHHQEPNTSVLQRLGIWFLSLLPIESQL